VPSPSGHGKGAPLRKAMSRYGAAPLLPFHYTHSTEPSTAFGLAGAFFARRPIADRAWSRHCFFNSYVAFPGPTDDFGGGADSPSQHVRLTLWKPL
jgi:hypothetical protein